MQNALIIVDMLEDFVNSKGKLFCGPTTEAIVPLIKEKIAAARKAGQVIIFLCDAHKEDDKEFKRFPPHAIRGSAGARIITELAPEEGDFVVNKTRYSGFYGTALANILDKHQITAVEVVGVCTSICVMDTVGGLVNRDIAVTIDEAAVADFDQNNHAAALGRMHDLYGVTLIKAAS